MPPPCGRNSGRTAKSWRTACAVPAADEPALPEGGATAYSFQLPEIEVTMEADSWIGVVFIATDNLGRTSTNGEFFTIQDDMLIFTDDTDPIWEAIPVRSGQRITSP